MPVMTSGMTLSSLPPRNAILSRLHAPNDTISPSHLMSRVLSHPHNEHPDSLFRRPFPQSQTHHHGIRPTHPLTTPHQSSSPYCSRTIALHVTYCPCTNKSPIIQSFMSSFQVLPRQSRCQSLLSTLSFTVLYSHATCILPSPLAPTTNRLDGLYPFVRYPTSSSHRSRYGCFLLCCCYHETPFALTVDSEYSRKFRKCTCRFFSHSLPFAYLNTSVVLVLSWNA